MILLVGFSVLRPCFYLCKSASAAEMQIANHPLKCKTEAKYTTCLTDFKCTFGDYRVGVTTCCFRLLGVIILVNCIKLGVSLLNTPVGFGCGVWLLQYL